MLKAGDAYSWKRTWTFDKAYQSIKKSFYDYNARNLGFAYANLQNQENHGNEV